MRLLNKCLRLVFAVGVSSSFLDGQAKNGTAFREFVDRLAAARSEAATGSGEGLAAADRVPLLQASEIVAALPSLRVALASRVVDVAKEGVFIAWAITRRPDGNSLLAADIETICAPLDLPDVHTQGAVFLVLMNFGTAPLQRILPRIIAYVESTDGTAMAQAAALGLLIRPDLVNSRVLEVISRYLARPMSKELKSDALDAMQRLRVNHEPIITVLRDALGDKDLRLTAVQVIGHMGSYAVGRSISELRALANDPTATADERQFAAQAIERNYGKP
jgi:hypothetical protein